MVAFLEQGVMYLLCRKKVQWLTIPRVFPTFNFGFHNDTFQGKKNLFSRNLFHEWFDEGYFQKTFFECKEEDAQSVFHDKWISVLIQLSYY